MMVLVIGGSGSGKSDYAEDVAEALWKKEAAAGVAPGKYYLATMQAADAESRRKAQRHRKRRSGKNFFTIEQPREIQRAVDRMETGRRVALLECMSNLVASEMFAGGEPRTEREIVEKIMDSLAWLKAETTHLIVVSNNVFEDGRIYDQTTMAYIRALGEINQRMACLAERVVEVVAGIPVVLKQDLAG